MSDTLDQDIYKLCSADEWRQAERNGSYGGSADDLRDGFIHLSTASQLQGTAEKYFTGRRNLLLVAFRASALGAELRWEPSRGGQLFPHVYATLDPALALWARPVPLDAAGVPVLPEDL